VGTVTWGKGLVQTVFTIRDTGLALTTARYYTPSGRCIQRDYHSYIDYITHRNGVPAATAGEKTRYHTDAGRPVTGGGGITPDVEVKARELDEGVARLYGQSAFFRFAVELLQDVPQEKQKAFARAFTVTARCCSVSGAS
jgi:Periplasmic protease